MKLSFQIKLNNKILFHPYGFINTNNGDRVVFNIN